MSFFVYKNWFYLNNKNIAFTFILLPKLLICLWKKATLDKHVLLCITMMEGGMLWQTKLYCLKIKK